MNTDLKWYRKSAESGEWSAVVLAESEEDVRELHEREQLLLPTLAHQYPGPFRIEALPPSFVPPEPLAALERGDFAAVEAALGLLPKSPEGGRESMSSPGYRPQRHTCGQVVWVNVELGTYWSADPDHGRMLTTCPGCHERLAASGFELGWKWREVEAQREAESEADHAPFDQ
ncbi:MAG TPA: hypothetical protein VKT82_01715 [Ktedonobacterales bacterium]|nr:hypothetical protein [Ktedonobacterales bacterium]